MFKHRFVRIGRYLIAVNKIKYIEDNETVNKVYIYIEQGCTFTFGLDMYAEAHAVVHYLFTCKEME